MGICDRKGAGYISGVELDGEIRRCNTAGKSDLKCERFFGGNCVVGGSYNVGLLTGSQPQYRNQKEYAFKSIHVECLDTLYYWYKS